MVTVEGIATSWSRAEVFQAPIPFNYGFEMSIAVIVGNCLMAFVSAVEAVGDVSGITKAGAVIRTIQIEVSDRWLIVLNLILPEELTGEPTNEVSGGMSGHIGRGFSFPGRTGLA